MLQQILYEFILESKKFLDTYMSQSPKQMLYVKTQRANPSDLKFNLTLELAEGKGLGLLDYT